MTAAYRLKGIGWLASTVLIVLGFYLVSLQVAAERKRLEDVNRRIAVAHRDIRALETEFETRANLAQLERWNGDTLALAAPSAGQFLHDTAQLASLDVRAVPGAEVRTAQLVVPSLPAAPAAAGGEGAPAPAQPAVGPALVQVAAVKPVVPAAQRAPAEPVLSKAVAVRAAPPQPMLVKASTFRFIDGDRSSAAVLRASAPARRQTVAMLDRKLLSDTTLGDILSGARREAGPRR